MVIKQNLVVKSDIKNYYMHLYQSLYCVTAEYYKSLVVLLYKLFIVL